MSKLTGPGSMFDRRSIRFPIVRLIVMAVLLGIGLALLTDAVVMMDNVRSDIRRSLTSAANAAGTAASAALAFGDAAAARDVLRMLEAYPEIEAAGVFPTEGPRLASFGNDRLVPADAAAVKSLKTEIAMLAGTATCYVPVIVDGVAIGTVVVRARLDAYWRTYLTTMATTLFVGLSAGALALLLAMRFLDRIILPVRLLAEVARDARLRQDFRPRPIPAADNEIGEMVSNFNALLAEIDTSRQSLQNYQNELERLVAARTAELSAAKEAAEQANQAKSRFLAAASHDLRQPIQAMHLFQDALGSTPLNDEQRRISDYLARSTRSLGEILNVLLDVSRLDGGMVKPHPEMLSVRNLLGTMEAEFAPLALAKGLRFKLFFPNRPLMVNTDAQLLHGLLRNLIDNALKYTESGGLLIGARRRGNRILLQVWDTGIGIAPEHLDAIFDEYFQVGNPQRDSTKGLGLGLSIVKRVAAILGGRVSCRSRPNKGSVFEISLPGASLPEPDAPIRPGVGAARERRLDGMRVAVIEDDLMAARAMEMSLGASGVEVLIFHSAEEALADGLIEAADFYVVDYRLPNMNGAEFLDAIQQRIPRPIKAALLTGDNYLDGGDRSRFGAWKVLFKPLEREALLAEIRNQLSSATNIPRDTATEE
jgi:signal transduction histidine kinase/ActR/RegA family two-component response regulator